MPSSRVFSPNPGILDLLHTDNRVLPGVPVGDELNTRGWEQESVLRMLLNHSDLSTIQGFHRLPAYEYEEMINWPLLRQNIQNLIDLEDNETLVIERGRTSGILKTSEKAPRVLQINSEISEISNFYENALLSYNHMNEEHWGSIGFQNILENTFDTTSSLAKKFFAGSLEGKISVTTGFGWMGVAQSLSVVGNKGVVVVVELNRKLLEKMVEDGYCNRIYEDFDAAFDVAFEAKRNGQSRVIGLLGNASEVLHELVNKAIVPNIIIDTISTLNPGSNYFPSGYSFFDALRIRKADPHHYRNLCKHSLMMQAKAMVELQKRGSQVFEYGNYVREQAYNRGLDNAYGFSSLITDTVYPLLVSRPEYKWIALSNNSDDIFAIDDLIISEFSEHNSLSRQADLANRVILPPGIYSRKCKLDLDIAQMFFQKINYMVRNGDISAPILLGISDFIGTEHNLVSMEDESRSEKILQKALNNQYNSNWMSISFMGSSDTYYTLKENMLLLDGTTDSEERLKYLVN